MIRWLNQVRASDVDLVGGKGASLAEMVHAGLPVPAGFCVTTQAYRAAVEPLGEQVSAWLAAGEHERLRQAVAQAPLPAGLAAQVAAAAQRLGGPLAVRSSATAEDLPQASFAGQQETVLGVVGAQDVLAALRRCWASLWSERAIDYRNEQDFAHQEVALAVVVQKMVPAEVAGVAFSADPVTGQRGVVTIDSSWGLGETVVSGAVTPDSFVVSVPPGSPSQGRGGGVPERSRGGRRSLPWTRDGGWRARAGLPLLPGLGAGGTVVSRRLGDKRTRTDLAPAGGTRTRATSARERQRLSLTSAQARQVAALARRVERYEHRPVDIEWAVAGGRLWLLQARPITALEPAGPAGSAEPAGAAETSVVQVQPARGPGGWARLLPAHGTSSLSRFVHADIVEHFPAPYPLDVAAMEIAVRALRAATAVAGVRIHGSVHDGSLVSVDDDGVVRLEHPRVSLWGLPLGVLRTVTTRWSDPRLWSRREGARARAVASRVAALPREQMASEELGGALAEVLSEAEELERARFVDYLGFHVLRGALLDALLRLARTGYSQLDLLGDLDYATIVIDRGLSQLAAAAPEPVRRLLTQETAGDVGADTAADIGADIGADTVADAAGSPVDSAVDADAVRRACPRWWEQVEAFLAEHGTRTTTMYQPFSSTSWGEDLPTFLSALAMRLPAQPTLASGEASGEAPGGASAVRQVGGAGARPGPGPGPRTTPGGGGPSGRQEAPGGGQALSGHRARAHEHLVAEVADRLPRPLRGCFARLVADFRAGYVMREDSVVEFERLGAVARGLALEAGRRLEQAGLVKEPRQVAYLRMGELQDWLRGEEVDVERVVSARVRARPRAEAVWHQQQEPGTRSGAALGLEGAGGSGAAPAAGAGTVLTGVAVSPGTATGAARVVAGPADFRRLQPGDVLVCRTTDPAWTPLFARAVAVVAETGGRLSHAAIVAREYAVPAVLGVAGATTRIADGTRVTVEGTTGRVVCSGQAAQPHQEEWSGLAGPDQVSGAARSGLGG